MNLDGYRLLNAIVSAAILGACLRLFLYLAKRVVAREFPTKQQFLMIVGLLLVSTLTGASHDVSLAVILFPAIMSAWFCGFWARKWVESEGFERFAERVSSTPSVAGDSRRHRRRRWFTILVPTAEEGLRCPACGNRAMSAHARLNTGPAKVQSCESCGLPVSPSWSFAVLLCALGASGFAGATLLPDYSIACLLAAVILILTLIFRYSGRVPLVRRHLKGPMRQA
jgi:hypothetical protein